jgi:putative phosphoesterase
MILGVISDIHGNNAALAVVLDEFRRRGVQQLVFLGDLVGYYAFAAESFALLAEFEVASVRGNHDQVALDCLEIGHRDERYCEKYGSALDRGLARATPALVGFLQGSPLTRTVQIAGRKFFACHGSPWDPLDGRVYPDFPEWERFSTLGVDVILLGHTHYPVARWCGSVLVLNPGSVGQSRHRSGVACAAVLDLPGLAHQLLELPYSSDALIADSTLHDPDLPYLCNVLRRSCA